MGIEPTWPAWKAGALPLSYTRFAPTRSGPRDERSRPNPLERPPVNPATCDRQIGFIVSCCRYRIAAHQDGEKSRSNGPS